MKRTIISTVIVIAGAVTAFAQEFKPIPNPPITKTVDETLNGSGEPVQIYLSPKHVIKGVVVDGRAYVAQSELSRAVSGEVLARGFKVDGDTLSTVSGDTGPGCKKCVLTFGKERGVLSSKLLRVKGKDGAEQILVPLDDLATAMGGSVKSDAVNKMFNVMGVGGAAGEAGSCKKCLLWLNPAGVNVNPATIQH